MSEESSAAPSTTTAPARPAEQIIAYGVDLAPVARLSEETLRLNGFTAAGAGWRDQAGQFLRFGKLLQASGVDKGRPMSVNDLGSGWGALHQFLHARGYEIERYRAYDISRVVLHAAQEGTDLPNARFVHSARVTHTADYSFQSGIFNVRAGSASAWKGYIREVIRNLAEHSRRGFAFNMLSTHNTYTADSLFYGDPAEWLDWCQREITPHVQLLHDYPLWEWTLGGRLDLNEHEGTPPGS